MKRTRNLPATMTCADGSNGMKCQLSWRLKGKMENVNITLFVLVDCLFYRQKLL